MTQILAFAFWNMCPAREAEQADDLFLYPGTTLPLADRDLQRWLVGQYELSGKISCIEVISRSQSDCLLRQHARVEPNCFNIALADNSTLLQGRPVHITLISSPGPPSIRLLQITYGLPYQRSTMTLSVLAKVASCYARLSTPFHKPTHAESLKENIR